MYISVKFDCLSQLTIDSNFIIYTENAAVRDKYIVYNIYNKQGIYKSNNIQYTRYINNIDCGYISNSYYNGIRYTITIYYNKKDSSNFISIHLDKYENILSYEYNEGATTFADFIELMLNTNFNIQNR
jgi:hypothetical protein